VFHFLVRKVRPLPRGLESRFVTSSSAGARESAGQRHTFKKRVSQKCLGGSALKLAAMGISIAGADSWIWGGGGIERKPHRLTSDFALGAFP